MDGREISSQPSVPETGRGTGPVIIKARGLSKSLSPAVTPGIVNPVPHLSNTLELVYVWESKP